jgi:hypothetical protein
VQRKEGRGGKGRGENRREGKGRDGHRRKGKGRGQEKRRGSTVGAVNGQTEEALEKQQGTGKQYCMSLAPFPPSVLR